MPRLFLGTYLEEDSQIALAKLINSNHNLAANWQCRINWAKPEQLHLTWIFLGEMDSDELSGLCQSIDLFIESNKSKFLKTINNCSVRYEKLILWSGHHQDNKTIVLTPEKVDTNFTQYAQKLRSELSKYANSNVRQQALNLFKPHITLARIYDRTGKADLPITQDNELSPEIIVGLIDLLPLKQAPTVISLIESREVNGQHRYKTIQDFSII